MMTQEDAIRHIQRLLRQAGDLRRDGYTLQCKLEIKRLLAAYEERFTLAWVNNAYWLYSAKVFVTENEYGILQNSPVVHITKTKEGSEWTME